MAYTDGATAIKGVLDLLLANAAFLSAIGGATKIHRGTIPATTTLPAMAYSKSGFRTGTRPQRQGGTNSQIWSRGTVTLSFATSPNYDTNIVRLALNALDNIAEYTVTGAGVIRWIRATDEVDEDVEEGDRIFRLTRVDLDIAAKAT